MEIKLDEQDTFCVSQIWQNFVWTGGQIRIRYFFLRMHFIRPIERKLLIVMCL